MAQQLYSTGDSSAKVGVQPKISPYLTFVSANTAMYNTSGIVQRVASAAPIMPPPVPAGLLNAVYNSGAGLRLILLTTPYPAAVLVYGAAAVHVGQNICKKKGAFKLLGGLNALAASNNLFALYNAKFCTTGARSKIALKLVGVSASGTRSAEMFFSGITTAAATEEANAPDTEGSVLKVA